MSFGAWFVCEDLCLLETSFDRTTALEQLQELNFAPSVQMQDVPRESLSHHLGFRKDHHEERDELDKKLARTSRISNFQC
jgi:histone deacetylase 1/2